MKIAIFGSTGKTGLCALEAALKKGYNIRILVRDKSRLPTEYHTNENIEVITGNVLNPSDVDQTVKGVEGVVVVLGTRDNLDPTTDLSDGTKNIVAAMKANNIDKISFCLSAFIFYAPEKVPPRMVELNEDHKRMYDAVKDSGLTYVAVLPPHISDDPASPVTVEHDKNPGRKISKQDLGEFLVASLLQPEHYGQKVGLANVA